MMDNKPFCFWVRGAVLGISAVTAEDFPDGELDIISVLVKAGLCDSRGDGRRNIQQGGVSVADEKVTDISTKYTLNDFKGEGLIIRRGKKKFAKVIAE